MIITVIDSNTEQEVHMNTKHIQYITLGEERPVDTCKGLILCRVTIIHFQYGSISTISHTPEELCELINKELTKGE